MSLAPLLGGLRRLALDKVVCRRHERHVRKRLGKVAELPLGARIVFLGQQFDVIAETGQLLAKFTRLVTPPEQHKKLLGCGAPGPVDPAVDSV